MINNEFIEQNIGLVKSCISKFFINNSDYDDIFQAGCLGLTRAAKTFDNNRGIKFSTYAVPFILGEIKNFFHSNKKIKVSRNLQKTYKLVSSEQESFLKENNRLPTLSEISEKLNISIEQILEALESQNNIDSIDDENFNLKSISYEESYEKLISERIDICEAISKLNDVEQKIIKLRFFNHKTQSCSAKILGMTQVQISRKEKKILQKLRLNLQIH